MTARGVAFTRRDPQEFVDELKARVNAFFETRGISPHANSSMVVKSITLLTALVVPYALILTGDYSPLAMLGMAVMMGVVIAGIGFAVSHDALHGAYSKHRTVNSLLGLTFDMLGANGYLWRIMHNVVHHTYTNVHGADTDLDSAWFLRLSPGAPHRWVHRFQHWYALGGYSLATLNWVFVKDFRFFLRREIGPYVAKRHPVGQWLLLFGGKFFYYTWAIILPLLLLDLAWWQFAIGFLAMHFTTGIILSVVFQLAHVVEETKHPVPLADGTMEHTWMVHELVTTANFAPRNPVLGWFVGGLNFQIEHHLFPRICSVHYPAISRIVRETCEKYGIPYNVHPTLFSAIHSHWAMLRRLGRGETAEAFAAA